MVRRKSKPDIRPHWNDNLQIMHRGKLFSADEWQEKSNFYLDVRQEPNWRNDPTYNLRVKRER